jgi:excisionase family DNA binding protein
MTTATTTPTATRSSSFLTLKEAADVLDVSVSTARRLVASGSLPSSRYGRLPVIRIERRDLIEFLGASRRWNGHV